MTHRRPGPVGVALLDDRVGCELIADGVAKLRSTDTLAGSVHFLSDALANAARLLGLTVPQAAALVSTNAARHYGWRDRGTIAVGNPADLVLLSNDLTIQAPYLAGHPITNHVEPTPRPSPAC